MYVIFPADELILMTYGIAIPRFKPRPTLDNLREPAVPIGPRRPPSPSAVKNALTPTAISAPSRKPPPAARRSITPIRTSPAPAPNIPTVTNEDRASLHSRHSIPKPAPTVPTAVRTDAFGYASTAIEDPPPQIFLEPPTPSVLSDTSSPTFSRGGRTSPLPPAKPKHKLHLHLPGRLGRSKAAQSPEPARLRDVTDIRIENPTFTSENLHQRNYDAFFDAGTPVYQLEHRSASPVSVEPPVEETPAVVADVRPRSLGLFHRRARAVETAAASLPPRAQSVDRTLVVDMPRKATVKNSERRFFGWRGARGGSLGPPTVTMATPLGILRDCTHPSLNETLKSHNNVTFKLVKTVSDFTEQLSQLYDHHAESLQLLVSAFRKKNSELRKERPACHSTLFQAWETFLQEIEADSAASGDVASTLSRQVSRPLLERTFHKKVQSRKIFTHRESFDTIIAKTEEKLLKCRLEYKQCYIAHRQNPSPMTLTMYLDSHNAYVQQLHATNAMMETYHMETIPQMTQELEEIYSELCIIVADGVLQGADTIATKASEQSKRYDSLSLQCRSVSGQHDLTSFLRYLQPESPPKVPRKAYAPPHPGAGDADDQSQYSDQTPIPLRNELIMERNASIQVRPSIEALKRESIDIEMQIKQLQDTIESLVRTQLRGIESQLYNKANEIQEDISMKKFDLRAKQIHLAAVKAQKELFLGKTFEPSSPRAGSEQRKLSVASSSSMKTKWLKAFRSLKPTSGAQPADKRNGPSATAGRVYESEHHNLQEYTYKKITPCDVCSQVLRGHTRQGLRCRICKLNVHVDCVSQMQKCQPKQKLLRRQKSTSEIDNRGDVDEDKDVTETISRPFGQPLCLVSGGADPFGDDARLPPLAANPKGARRKK